MKRHFLTAVTAFSLLFLGASLALAQTPRNCAPRDVVLKKLAETFGEARQMMGLAANDQVVEVFASQETGTWTILVTLPNGMTCVAASGQAFERLPGIVEPTGLKI